MTHSQDDRSSIAQGYAWSVRITSIALEMALPGLLGFWLDRRLGTVPVFVIVGVALGMITAITHLLRIASDPETGARERPAADAATEDGEGDDG